jgi:hypothetical protein
MLFRISSCSVVLMATAPPAGRNPDVLVLAVVHCYSLQRYHRLTQHIFSSSTLILSLGLPALVLGKVALSAGYSK